jgi:copper transport protein
VKKLLLLLGVLLGGALIAAGPAQAHATLVSSSPSDGQRLQQAPTSVSITFDEQVGLGSLGYLHVTNQGGDRVESGNAGHRSGDDTTIQVALKAGLPDGTYTESYRVVSADSHPITGVVRFVVGDGPLVISPVSGGGGTVNHVTSVALDVARWISWAGLALLGGAWMLLSIWPAGRDDRRARTIVWTGWGSAVVGAVLEVLLQGPYAAGLGLSKVADWSLIDSTLHSDYGQWHSARLVILGAIAILLGRALQLTRSRYEEIAPPLALALAFSFSATGHAETTNPNWLSLLADTLHLAAMATWVGGLVILVAAVLPRRDPEELDVVLPVFSKVAFTAVVVMAATGTYAAWRGVGSLRALVHTEYGVLVLAKILLFIGLLAVGNLSRRVVQRKLVVAYAMTDDVIDEPDLRAERLRRSVLVEIVLAVVVLAATAMLVGQPRGAEALATQDREPVTAGADLGGGRTATVTLDPGQHGPLNIQVTIVGSSSAPKSVTGTASLPSRQLGPIPLNLVRESGGLYTSGGIDLPVAGDWVIDLVVTSSKFDAVTADVHLHLT